MAIAFITHKVPWKGFWKGRVIADNSIACNCESISDAESRYMIYAETESVESESTGGGSISDSEIELR